MNRTPPDSVLAMKNAQDALRDCRRRARQAHKEGRLSDWSYWMRDSQGWKRILRCHIAAVERQLNRPPSPTTRSIR